jgi:hypothetical protein
VIAPVIVVDLGFEIAREVIVLDTVLERLMPALNLSLGHGVIGRAHGRAQSALERLMVDVHVICVIGKQG